MSEIQAAEYMKAIVYKAADNWFTNWYDKIQWIQQKIYHWEREVTIKLKVLRLIFEHKLTH